VSKRSEVVYINGAPSTPGYLLALLRELLHVPRGLTQIAEAKHVRKTNQSGILYQFKKWVSKSRSPRFEPKISLISFSRGSGPSWRLPRDPFFEKKGSVFQLSRDERETYKLERDTLAIKFARALRFPHTQRVCGKPHTYCQFSVWYLVPHTLSQEFRLVCGTLEIWVCGTIDWFWDPIFLTNWDVRDVDKLSWDL